MAQYHDLADRLRARIQSGEFPIGAKLPSISELQQQYDVHSPGTVRTAHQLLAEEGLIETRQGAGAFVIGVESLKAIDIRTELAGVRDRLTTVLAAIESQKHRHITIDLDDPTEPHLDFVLTDALRDYAHHSRWEAENEARDEQPDSHLIARRIEWAEAAERLAERIATA
ncbi:winged helix-turn-helix domain-containing protein [Nocardia sp. NPDC050435]|uniref:winged helix-turn-helix domain-containing protein n=1 Tax=Nocardia sp. NPDC050435 TaxID=3155040 RepID=UPI0033EF5AEB